MQNNIKQLSTSPLVSVITATYNRENYLPLAIESVLEQTYKNLEYIVIDDGSTDNTRELLEKYSQDNRLTHYYQENQGQTVAKNAGLKRAKGEFICFLDSDNLWIKDKLEKQIQIFLKKPEYDIVYGDVMIIDENNNDLSISTMKCYSGKITEQLLIDNFVTFNTAMFHRKCYDESGGMDEILKRSPDYELWLRYSINYKFLYISEVFARYRVWQNQISSNTAARLDTVQFILSRFIDLNRENLSNQSIKNTWFYHSIKRGSLNIRTRKYNEAMKNYARAIYLKPISMIPYRSILWTLFKR